MSTEIDPRITPALHPTNVTQIEGYDEDTKAVLGPTETAFSAAYEGLRAIYATRAKVEKNPAWTEAHRLIQLDEFGRKHLEKITRAFDTTRANLVKGIEHLEQELSAPVTARADRPGISQEIRSHVKALSTGNRMAFVRKAIEDGDEATANAVLGAPAYLSGLDAGMSATLLRFWHEKQNPAAAKRLKVMQGARDLIERNAPLVFTQVEKAVGAPGHKVKKLREAHSEAEKALIMRDLT